MLTRITLNNSYFNVHNGYIAGKMNSHVVVNVIVITVMLMCYVENFVDLYKQTFYTSI